MSGASKTVCVLCCGMVVLFGFALQASAAGFDDSYNVFRGDFNGDGRMDLYISSSRVISIALDDIPIVIPPPVRDFVLQNRGDGSFNLIANLTNAQRAAMAAWPAADVGMSVRDIDVDGHPDLDLQSIARAIPGARDLILLSSPNRRAAPRQLIDKTSQFQNFHYDLASAIQNPNYFDDNAPNRVVSQEPPSRSWYASIRNAGDFASTSLSLSWCRRDFPGSQCNLSTVDPTQCVRRVNLYDAAGNYIGTGTRDVCSDYIHVFVYVPGSVTVARDYSVFDQRARETEDILERLQNGCSLFTPSADTQRINDIVNGVYNSSLYIPDRFTPNSVPHPPAPGDELFDQNDPTFHHYDVRSKVCDIGQPACNVVNASSYSYMGLRAFTFPSRKLEPTYTPVDGSELTVYVSVPQLVNNPDAYTLPFGRITQRMVQTGYFAEAIQNVTTPQHWVYPGTIARKIFREGNSLYVRTHGMGTNRFWCIPALPVSPTAAPAVYGTRMIVAASNDNFGAKAFHTLDVQMIKTFRAQNGYPAGPQGLPPDTPASPEDLASPFISRDGSPSTE